MNHRFVSARCIRVTTCLLCLMRLFCVLPIFSLLFGARASSLDSRTPTAHPLDARDLIDVCASIDTDLVVPDLLGGILSAAGALSQFNVPLS